MKTKILIIGVALFFLSCEKNSEQIDIVKKQIASKFTPTEIAEMKYDCVEILDKDAYRILSTKARKDSQDFSDRGNYENALKCAEKAGKYIDSAEEATGKKFYRVNYYRMTANDTVTKGFIVLNDKNKKIGFTFQK